MKNFKNVADAIIKLGFSDLLLTLGKDNIDSISEFLSSRDPIDLLKLYLNFVKSMKDNNENHLILIKNFNILFEDYIEFKDKSVESYINQEKRIIDLEIKINSIISKNEKMFEISGNNTKLH